MKTKSKPKTLVCKIPLAFHVHLKKIADANYCTVSDVVRVAIGEHVLKSLKRKK